MNAALFTSLWGSRTVLVLVFVGAGAVAADPLVDYEKACEAPYFARLSAVAHPSPEENETLFDAAWSASDVACSRLVKRLAAISDPSPEGRLALIKARAWLGEYTEEQRCDEVQALAGDLTGQTAGLYELAQCAATDVERMSLLQKVLDLDPRHHDALKSLTGFVSHTGDDHGMDTKTLDQHRRTFYEVAKLVDYKITAAMHMHKAANEAGGREAIRNRLRRDLGLDAMDYGPARRDGSLSRYAPAQCSSLISKRFASRRSGRSPAKP